ncbi:hypothetical protein NC653_027179 [Populus alba x Populus x berolinensis]|uniref:B box-type domain-containing protein n=1 Tax=Populus alba x Populus x berolinensis TaxID=444605 RepID=A0AAD6M504_9ROSI|nr:hypothetical protein NC653_027179 [Populus alba x Populus x berolinensis]
MKRCELCDSLAKVYCESDQANLCWDCDANVHSANFLVAKHSRSLLCHVCQSLTPWTGTGHKLGPTLSVCNNCVNNSSCREERGREDDEEGDNDDDDDDDDLDREEDGDEDEDEENGDGGNDHGGEDDEENQNVQADFVIVMEGYQNQEEHFLRNTGVELCLSLLILIGFRLRVICV